MAGILQVKDLEAKKKALAAESELYRQTLNLELQNLRLYALRAKKRFASFGRFNPLMMLGLSLTGSMLRRRFSWPRLAMTVLLSWQLYNRIAGLRDGLFSGRFKWRK